jgi:hypothetical protein
VGHAYIHHHNVGSQLFGFLDPILAIDGFATNLEVIALGEECPHTAAHNLVIIHD